MTTSLRQLALQALLLTSPSQKCAAVAALVPEAAPVGEQERLEEPAALPGRPALPALLPPREVKQPSIRTPQGHAAIIHALTHIEFNAINLALDAAWRFSDMPANYYLQWLLVAREEAQHFQLLVAHLKGLGHAYGDFPAHNSLWDMVERTKHDVLARMALVPRTMEARGLDASPLMKEKLLGIGDHSGAAIIDIILRDEIGHVAIGNQWFRFLCVQRNCDPLVVYPELARLHSAPNLRPPHNIAARLQAGFVEEEIQALITSR
jgi:uncharacterized ferritin-like protein (DUF455 family)